MYKCKEPCPFFTTNNQDKVVSAAVYLSPLSRSVNRRLTRNRPQIHVSTCPIASRVTQPCNPSQASSSGTLDIDENRVSCEQSEEDLAPAPIQQQPSQTRTPPVADFQTSDLSDSENCDLSGSATCDLKIPWDEFTVQDDGLKRLGMVLNTKLRILTCINCKRTIDPTLIPKHLQKEHGIPRNLIDDELCETFRTKYSLTPFAELQPLTTFGPPIPNLELRAGYHYCSECCHAVKLYRSLDGHPCPRMVRKTGYAQSLTASRHQGGWFAVSKPKTPQDEHTLNPMAVFKAKHPELAPENRPIRAPQHARDTNHFLAHRHWIPLVEGLTGDSVWKAARETTDPELKAAISTSIDRYIDKIQEKFDGPAFPHSWRESMGSYDGSVNTLTPLIVSPSSCTVSLSLKPSHTHAGVTTRKTSSTLSPKRKA